MVIKTPLELILKIYFSRTKQVSTFVGHEKIKCATSVIEKGWIKEEKIIHKIRDTKYCKFSFSYTLTDGGKQIIKLILNSAEKTFNQLI